MTVPLKLLVYNVVSVSTALGKASCSTMAATHVFLPAAVPTQPAWHFETLRCQLPCVTDGLGVGGERPSEAFAFISKHTKVLVLLH